MNIKYPKGIHAEAKEFGEAMIKELERQNVIQDLDINLLNLAVMSYHTFVVTRNDVLETGPTYKTDGFIKQNPSVAIMKDQQVQLFKVFDQLGMSPKARKMLNQMPDVPGETISPLDVFLTGVTKKKDVA